ncbi:hypothetical protein FH972_023065 [Carpinus fangiana]|uniref:Aminoglycoside phosphotransferase domain-containing protein n=1 Tax=Carpinus fangiana TaxID=176857 RepID=A0A5N6KUL0_9ROSI|nr:hypothetical protein FH972_023065 [Carpinus fangiana]
MNVRDYLPNSLSNESIRQLLRSLRLPEPQSIRPLDFSGEYHAIYMISFFPNVAASLLPAQPTSDGSVTLVLRVSGKHYPHIKTANEVAVMTWLHENTTIPVPAVIRYDSSGENPIGHEFTLLEKVSGESADKLYPSLDADIKKKLVLQLTAFVIELHSHSQQWQHVGGLRIQSDGTVGPGPVLEETMWQIPAIQKFWGQDETSDTLNISGPYTCYTEYASAHLKRYQYAISKHPSLASMRDLVPRIDALISVLEKHADTLNKTRYILAHKDLHFGNVMCDPETGMITAVLDWEFSAVVPIQLWNRPSAFLWNCDRNWPLSKSEQDIWMKVFSDECDARSVPIIEEARASPLQEAMQDVVDHLRSIVEVAPRGIQEDDVPKWRAVVEARMEKFGV